MELLYCIGKDMLDAVTFWYKKHRPVRFRHRQRLPVNYI
jgi:hypothetical protein